MPGGSHANLRFVSGSAHFDPALTEVERLILADPQTSGGLLLAVPLELVAELEAQGTLARAVVGELAAGKAGRVEVVAG